MAEQKEDKVNGKHQKHHYTEKAEDQPLRVAVTDKRLVISVGINRLEGNDCHPTIPELKIDDLRQWGEDVAMELQRDDEQGASLLSNMLDKAIQEAIEMGSIAINQTAYERAMKKRDVTHK